MNDPLVVRAKTIDGRQSLLAPSVGAFIPSVKNGALVRAGDTVGVLQVLSRTYPLQVPRDVAGLVSLPRGRALREPMQFGDVLLHLDPVEGVEGTSPTNAAAAGTVEGLTIDAPQSGRFYVRPAPDKPPFVQEGDELRAGQPLGLIEVMKTFAQLRYGSPDLPETAHVKRVLVGDGEEVQKGDPLFLVE